MKPLTLSTMAAIQTPLLPHVAAGLRNPHKAAKGHYQTWFFCTHQKLISILLWWGFIEQPLKRLAAPWRYCELDNIPATQTLAIMGGGLSLLQGLSA